MFAIMMFLHGRHCSSSVFLLVFNEYIDNLNSDFISRLLSSSRIYWYQIFLYCYTTMYWKLTAMWWENGCLLFVKTKTKEWDSLESLFAQHNQILNKTVFCDCLSQLVFWSYLIEYVDDLYATNINRRVFSSRIWLYQSNWHFKNKMVFGFGGLVVTP